MWCMFVLASLYMRWEENQLYATEWFITPIICSTCFGHLYAHHQELETILVLLPHMVGNVLVAGGRRDEGECSSSLSHPGHIACCPTPDRRPPATKALPTICSNNTSTVWSSWWWAYNRADYKCNKPAASSCFSSLSLIDLFRPRQIVSSKVFQVVFVNYFYNL